MSEKVWIHPEGAADLVDAMKSAERLVTEGFTTDLKYHLRVAQSDATEAAQRSFNMFLRYQYFLEEYREQLIWRADVITSADPATVGEEGGMLSVTMPFSSPNAAKSKAEEMAENYLKDGELSEEEWAALAEYMNDPNFAEQFVQLLGPDDLYVLAAKNPEQAETIGSLLAAASRAGLIDEEWLNDFHGPDDSGVDAAALAHLIQHGTWDSATLVAIGSAALDSGVPATEFALILDALAKDPIAANEFYTAEFDRIQALMRAGTIGSESTDIADSLSPFVTAATITAYELYEQSRPAGDETWENPAVALTDRLVADVAANPNAPPHSPEMQAVFGDIITFYVEDVWDSVTSPVPDIYEGSDPARHGVEATPAEWAAFTQQAMRDPETAAELVTLFASLSDAAWEALPEANSPGSGEENAANYSIYQITRVDDWFRTQVEATNDTLRGENDAWNQQVNEFISNGVDVVLNPAATADGILKGLLAEGFKAAATSTISDYFTKEYTDIDSGSPTKADYWQQSANKVFEDGAIVPVDGHDGDPKSYEEEYGATFTQEVDGKTTIMDPATMSPEAMRAYEAWLQDPAVQNAAWVLFDAQTSETED